MKSEVFHKWDVYFDRNAYSKEIITDVAGPDAFSFVANVAMENKGTTDNRVTKVEYKGSINVFLQDDHPVASRSAGKRQIDVGE